MNLPTALLGVLLSATALTLGIPNEFFRHGLAILGPVALVPLFYVLDAERSYRRSGIFMGMFYMLVHLMSSFWLAYFKEFAIFTLGASSLTYFFLGYPIGWYLKETTTLSPTTRPFAVAAVWVAWEWIKSTGFLAYPWGTLVMTSFSLKPLIQIADITGVWGIGFILALVSASIVAALRHRLWKPLTATAFLILLASGYGLYRMRTAPEPVTSLDTILVQNNADPWQENGLTKNLITGQRLTRKSLAKGDPSADLAVWSESILTRPFVEHKRLYERTPPSDPFLDFMRETDTPLLVGSPVIVSEEPFKVSNSVILIGPDGTRLDWYAKIQLVPFAEYIPFTEYRLVRLLFDSIVGFSSSWEPGKRLTVMSVLNKDGKVVKFATPICFEDAFPSVCAALHNQGSDLLINLTNDSWSRTDSAEMQHFVIAAFRAIELRTTLVRSTNAGYTAVIGPTGRVLADLPLFTTDSLRVDVPIYPRTRTFYARFGDYVPLILLTLLSAMLLIDAFRINRTGARLLRPLC